MALKQDCEFIVDNVTQPKTNCLNECFVQSDDAYGGNLSH